MCKTACMACHSGRIAGKQNPLCNLNQNVYGKYSSDKQVKCCLLSWIFDQEWKSHLCLQRPPPQPDSQSDKASAVFLPAYTRIRHCRVLYLYARFPFLCVICDVKQVSKALVGDELVVCGDNACVSPRCCVSLFLFPLQPPLLLQDFLPGNQTELFAPSRYGSLLFYSQILC